MKKEISINSVLGNLDLITAEMDCTEKLMDVYHVFESNIHYPGIIIKKDKSFYRMLSKSKFYQVMSRQYMFDLFSRRTVEFFFDDSYFEPSLILNEDTKVIEAANRALLREDKYRFEPIIVITNENKYKLLSIHTLLLAQNEVQFCTLELLKDANEFKKDVLRIVSHDLRSPLSGISGFANLMLSSTFELSNTKIYAEQIQIAAEHMKNLINDFLLIAINDSTDFELNRTKIDLTEITKYVISNYKKSSINKNQSLIFDLDDKVIIEADQHKITEVIDNLISNAIKYSESGKKIIINLKSEIDIVKFSVKDEGPGLSDSDLELIFGKFQKLSNRPTGNESSTGLGLYIAKKIIEKHNGKIWVESELKKGSTFHFSLPITIASD